MTVLHWTYLFFVFLVIVAMVKRRRVVLITTVGAFTIGLGYTGSLIGGADGFQGISECRDQPVRYHARHRTHGLHMLKAMQDMGPTT